MSRLNRSARHARPCSGHPRLCGAATVDGRDTPGRFVPGGLVWRDRRILIAACCPKRPDSTGNAVPRGNTWMAGTSPAMTSLIGLRLGSLPLDPRKIGNGARGVADLV